MKTLEEYVQELKQEGFQLQEDAIGFIYFGKHYTNASDEIINTAIELTLKVQKRFDGSFYISLLESFMANKILTRQEAFSFAKEKELLSI